MRIFKPLKISVTREMITGTAMMMLLVPAAVFWSAVLIYTTLQTDYMMDVVILPFSQRWWGNTIIILLISGIPVAEGLYCFNCYRATQKQLYKWLTVAASLLAAAGTAVFLLVK